jgi:lysophospholipase L1-like esterase
MSAMVRFLLLPIFVLLALVVPGCGDDKTDGDRGAGTTAPSATDTSRPGGRALRYAVIGDSNSNGENAGPDGGASPDRIAWPAQLARRLTDEGLPVELVANPAITGTTIDQANAEELQAFKDAKPQVATLMIGNNDWVAGVTPDDFRTQFRELLDTMVETVGGPERVIAVSLTAFYVTPGGKEYVGERDAVAGIREFNDIVKEESEEAGVAFVSVFDLTEAMGDDPSLVAPDGLHATEKELKLWTDRIAPVAKERWSKVAG